MLSGESQSVGMQYEYHHLLKFVSYKTDMTGHIKPVLQLSSLPSNKNDIHIACNQRFSLPSMKHINTREEKRVENIN
jgi:hypothetical protein